MQLPNTLLGRLAQEYRFAADKMAEESDPRRKMYFFSVFFGEASRVLNWAWDRDLVLAYSILHHAHQEISGRLNSSSREVLLSDEFFGRLAEAASALASYFESGSEGQDLQVILGRFAELTYAANGNGNYLVERGLLKF